MQITGIHYQTGQPVRLSIENGIIRHIESCGHSGPETLPYVAPGLVDLQVNGFKGIDFNAVPLQTERILQVTRELWREGVTTYFPTITTNAVERIEAELQAVHAASREEPDCAAAIGGIHLEGPFNSPEDGPRGAHRREHILAPDWDLFRRWQEAAGGTIRILTMSPEWPGSAEFIRRCTESGVTVSIGHTSASPEQIREAAAAGASMSTHLGNGTHVMLPRHPNYLWEQLAEDRLWACVIADGFHLPESVLKVMFKVKGDRAIIVSDATYLSGLPAGEYRTQKGIGIIKTEEGKLILADNPKLLAGSAQMQLWGIRHLLKSDLAGLSEAWDMASIRPAACMRLPQQAGLREGAPADLVLFDRHPGEHRLDVRQTYKNGQCVHTVDGKQGE